MSCCRRRSAQPGVADTEAWAAGEGRTKSCRLTYSGTGREERRGERILKLAGDIYRVEAKTNTGKQLPEDFESCRNLWVRLFLCYLKIVRDTTAAFRREQLRRWTTARKCIRQTVKVLLCSSSSGVYSNNKLRDLSPRANYTGGATAACRRSECQLLRIEGATWSAWRIPYVCILGFLDRSRYFFFQIAPQLYSWGWVDAVPDPLLLGKYGIAENRTRDLTLRSILPSTLAMRYQQYSSWRTRDKVISMCSWIGRNTDHVLSPTHEFIERNQSNSLLGYTRFKYPHSALRGFHQSLHNQAETMPLVTSQPFPSRHLAQNLNWYQKLIFCRLIYRLVITSEIIVKHILPFKYRNQALVY
jgi:hypothetical protein